MWNKSISDNSEAKISHATKCYNNFLFIIIYKKPIHLLENPPWSLSACLHQDLDICGYVLLPEDNKDQQHKTLKLILKYSHWSQQPIYKKNLGIPTILHFYSCCEQHFLLQKSVRHHWSSYGKQCYGVLKQKSLMASNPAPWLIQIIQCTS